MDTSRLDAAQLLESDPLAKQRIESVERDIDAWAQKPIEFSFKPAGTHLFSIEELARAYAMRASDFAKSIRFLLAKEHVIPATIVGRALIETIAMACLFLHEMDRLVTAGNLERLEARFTKFYAGVKGQQIEPVHVMDALRHMEKIDAEYVQYLDDKYGMFAVASKIAKTAGHGLTRDKFVESLSVMKNYDQLSEVAHPNGVGTQLMYGQPGPTDDTAEALRRRFHQASLMSIWSCHHMLVALEKNADFAERYRSAFMTSK